MRILQTESGCERLVREWQELDTHIGDVLYFSRLFFHHSLSFLIIIIAGFSFFLSNNYYSLLFLVTIEYNNDIMSSVLTPTRCYDV